MVTTVQQVGGSIATALLSTLAASAATKFAANHQATSNLRALAAIHGYVTVFYYSALIFALGAVAAWFLLGRGMPDGLAQREAPQDVGASAESS